MYILLRWLELKFKPPETSSSAFHNHRLEYLFITQSHIENTSSKQAKPGTPASSLKNSNHKALLEQNWRAAASSQYYQTSSFKACDAFSKSKPAVRFQSLLQPGNPAQPNRNQYSCSAFTPAWNSTKLTPTIKKEKKRCVGRGKYLKYTAQRTAQLIIHNDERKGISTITENNLNYTKITRQNYRKHKVLKWHSKGRIQEKTEIKGHMKKWRSRSYAKKKTNRFCYFL